MATKRPPSATPTSSSTRSTKRRSSPYSLTELHALRHKIAAQFDYDATRIMAHVDSLPLPSWIRVINIKTKPNPKPKP